MITFNILLYIAGIIVGWIIFYYVVKAAVKNGIREREATAATTTNTNSNSGKSSNAEQLKLQQQYEKGKITFEVYHSEWNKLNS